MIECLEKIEHYNDEELFKTISRYVIKYALTLELTQFEKKLCPATQDKIKSKKHPRMTQGILAELMDEDEIQIRRWKAKGIPKTRKFFKFVNVLGISWKIDILPFEKSIQLKIWIN